MNKLIIKLLKQVCGDTLSAIVQRFLLWIFVGVFGVSFLLEQSRDFLIAILHKCLPIWIPILLLLFLILLVSHTYRYLSKKQKFKYMKCATKIEKWRSFIENFDFQNSKFGDTTVYSELRPYINQDDKDYFEDPTYFRITNNRRGNIPQKQILSDLVTKIEKDWNLS